jgi:Galactose-3-O-sulfotransferase
MLIQIDRRFASLRSYLADFLTLQQKATLLQQGLEGYRAAFEGLSAEVAQVRDERDRLLETLRKVSDGRRSLPPGLAGRQLCFLHIGKTAGTSVQHALFEAFWGAAIFHESLPGFDRVTPAELALNDLIIGHFMYQHVSKMRSAKFLMTFLRDPIDRVISNYHFLRTKSPHSRYSETALQAACSLSFKDFLLCDDPNVRMVTENFQTKALAYDIRPDHLNEMTTSALLETAERNLGEFDFVGISEYFDDGVRALSEILCIELSTKKLNVNPDRPFAAPTAEELDIARSLNGLDIQLYSKARLRFERIHLSGIGASTTAVFDRNQNLSRRRTRRAARG